VRRLPGRGNLAQDEVIRAFAERDNTNIVHWSRFDVGGHYAALEQPAAVVGDQRTFFAAGQGRRCGQ
jgi:hypothetical protein